MSKRFLLFEQDTYSYHCRLIHEGIRRYFLQGHHELTFIPLGVAEVDIDHPSAQDKFAIICWMQNHTDASFLREHSIPYLNLCESGEASNLGLSIRFAGEGRLAVEFLADELGIDQLIFAGINNSSVHRRRLLEYETAARERGLRVEMIMSQPGMAGDGPRTLFTFDRTAIRERTRELTQLLRRIPKPAGIFCGDDRLALNLYYLARRLGIPVPEHVSILGVGGSHRAEEGGVQAISVVQLDHIRQGYLAAEMMERRLRGEEGAKTVTLAPDGIAQRTTTPRRGVKDPLVREAFEIIDQDRGITVAELSRRLKVSRQTLREHFINATNMSAGRAIDLERFHHAKQLLRSHNYNHQGVATLAGYRNHKQMLRSFERLVQMSPGQFSKIRLKE